MDKYFNGHNYKLLLVEGRRWKGMERTDRRTETDACVIYSVDYNNKAACCNLCCCTKIFHLNV